MEAILVGGALMGVVYALVALGLTLVFGVMRLVNFAHGEMVVAGMYVGWWCHELLGLGALGAAPIAAAVMFLLGAALQRFLLQDFVARPQHSQFIVFIGIALVITGIHLIAFGADSRPIMSMASFETVTLFGLRLDLTRVQAAGVAFVAILLLAGFLRFTDTGQAIRAAADNRVGAEAVGIRVNRVYLVTAGLGAACAGVAGAVVAPIFDTQPYLAVEFTLIAFVTVIVGGLGSLRGALVGGVLIGFAEAVAALAIQPSLKTLFSYALLVLVLLLRPAGLFGTQSHVR